jgi:predicted permease
MGVLTECSREIGLAIRQLRKAPGITAAAVLSLALGIGANTAVFTLIESTLLRPIPVKHSERLRLLTWLEPPGGWVAPRLGYRSPTFGTVYEQREAPGGGLLHTDFTPPLYRQFARDRAIFSSLFAFKELGRVTAVVDGNAEPANCFLVSGEFYSGLEIHPAIGRAIRIEDDAAAQQNQVALISYDYWSRRFGRSPAVIGKTIRLNDVPVTIIGVNPEYFTGIEPGAHFEIWAPLNLSSAIYGRLQQGADLLPPEQRALLEADKLWSVPMMGRLQPGISDAQAERALDAQFQAAVDANPGPLASFLKEPAKRPRFLLQPAARGLDYLTARYDKLLLAVLLLAGMVLLIACANVANLLLAKSAVRRREISLRLALGAGRWRIARQLLTEGLLLAAVGGAAGLLLAFWTRNGIPALLATPWRPSPFDAALDLNVLLLSTGVTLLTGVLFSLAPVWQSRRVEVNEALKDGGRGTSGLSRLRMGRLLVVLQVALSVVLLVGAGLCLGTLANLKKLPLGFQPRSVLVFSVDAPLRRYPAARMPALLVQLRQRLDAIPGVQSAAFSGGRTGTVVSVDNRERDRNFDAYARATDVGSGFFETMGVRILNGRAIGPQDRSGGRRVVVVNEAFRQHFFPGENSLGRTFHGSNHESYEIVGVCADWRTEQFRDPVRPAIYGALMQDPQPGTVEFELRIAGNQASVVRQIRETVRAVDPNLAIADVHTTEEQIENALAQERLMASLAAVFGALALLLASIGIYGVMAYAVTRRTSEIGIRVALGAHPRGVAWIVLGETLRLAAAGAALGLPAVWSAGPVLDHFLEQGWQSNFAYGLKANDPMLFSAAVLALGAMAFCAGYFPARRAARIDPMVALRHE